MKKQADQQLKEGQFEAAIEGFTAHLLSHPEDVSAWRGRGIARFQLKHWQEAISDFSKARDIDPEDLEAWIGLGMSLAMDLKIHPAIDVLETLLERHPDCVRGHIQLGMLYYRLCVIAQGRKHMEQALASRPTLAERGMIERILSEQKKLDNKRYHRPDFEALRKKAQDEKRV